jgi:hypothetical protein
MDTLTSSKTALSAMLAKSREMDEHKAHYVNPARAHHFNDDARLTAETSLMGMTSSIVPLELTDHALYQACSKLAPSVYGKGTTRNLPFDYIKAIRPEVRAYVLNEHLTRAEGDWMVRAYDDKCRAVLSGQYSAIGNSELLEVLETVVSASSNPSSLTKTSEVTPDTLNARIIFKNVTAPNGDGRNGDWGMGVYIGNGETGLRRLRVLPLIQRHSCQNSIIVDQGKGAVEFVHRGSAQTKRILVHSAMAEILPFAAKLLEKMIIAEGEKLPDFSEVLDGLAEQYHWEDATKTKVAIGCEGQETRAGLVNGITYAAHECFANPDDVADMEVLGGTILLAPGSVFHKAVRVARFAAEREAL